MFLRSRVFQNTLVSGLGCRALRATQRAFSMGKLQTGIVGLPNVGKSTLFNALVGSEAAQAANFPFCTIGDVSSSCDGQYLIVHYRLYCIYLRIYGLMAVFREMCPPLFELLSAVSRRGQPQCTVNPRQWIPEKKRYNLYSSIQPCYLW